MPTRAQLDELINYNYTMTIWVSENGIYGRKIISKSNGESIFIPATGKRDGQSLYATNSAGNYWPSTASNSYCLVLKFGSSDISTNYSEYRYFGITVRPVLKQ